MLIVSPEEDVEGDIINCTKVSVTCLQGTHQLSNTSHEFKRTEQPHDSQVGEDLLIYWFRLPQLRAESDHEITG